MTLGKSLPEYLSEGMQKAKDGFKTTFSQQAQPESTKSQTQEALEKFRTTQQAIRASAGTLSR